MQKVEGSNPFIRLKPSGVRDPAAFFFRGLRSMSARGLEDGGRDPPLLAATPSTQKMWSVEAVRRVFRSTAAKYVGIFAVLALVAAIVPGASKGSVSSQANAKRASFKDVVVSLSGRIGPINGRYLRIERSTEAAVVKAEKRKPNWRGKEMGRGGPVARALEYKVRIAGSKKTCTRYYSFPFSTHRLSDFESNCRYLRTSRGIRVGMVGRKRGGVDGTEGRVRTSLWSRVHDRGICDHRAARQEMAGRLDEATRFFQRGSLRSRHEDPPVRRTLHLVGNLRSGCDFVTFDFGLSLRLSVLPMAFDQRRRGVA